MSKKSFITLGIDPGTRCTGYGIIQRAGSEDICLAHGHIKTKSEEQHNRLYEIYQDLCEVIATLKPDVVSIEKVFMHANVQSALKLGQARGVALLAAAHFGLPVFEYSPREIKKAVVGYGAADKNQVQHMVKTLLQLKNEPQPDAADALAIALCHCQSAALKAIV